MVDDCRPKVGIVVKLGQFGAARAESGSPYE